VCQLQLELVARRRPIARSDWAPIQSSGLARIGFHLEKIHRHKNKFKDPSNQGNSSAKAELPFAPPPPPPTVSNQFFDLSSAAQVGR